MAPNLIATNHHVIETILNEGALGGAKLVGKDEIYAIEDIVKFDKEKDLAIIKVKEVKGTEIDVPALSLGNSEAVQIGEKIYVAGNPEGLEGTFSDGIISAIRGDSTYKVFQMTAPISQGSSGGPVLNEKGEVIGVSVATLRDGQNLNFAVAVNHLKTLMPIPSTPVMKHNPPSSLSVGEKISLTLDLISSKAPRQVTIFYKTYDRDGDELATKIKSQKMRLWDEQLTSSTRTYRADLPPQKRVGSIEYYIEVEYDNRMIFRYPRDQSHYYQISIVDNKQPTISVLEPPDDKQFRENEQITVRAKVIDNSIVKDVRIYFVPGDSQKLSEEGSSDIYAMEVSFSQAGPVEYYLTATDEAGNRKRAKSRLINIIPLPIEDNNPPRINLLDSPDREQFTVNQQITIRAKVTDDTIVKEVLVHFFIGQ